MQAPSANANLLCTFPSGRLSERSRQSREIVWSRVFVEGGALHADIGRGTVVELSDSETERRWRETTYEWPIVNAIFHGAGRDAFMARHRANHVSIAYAQDADYALSVLGRHARSARSESTSLRLDQ